MLYVNNEIRMSKIDNRNIMVEYLKNVVDRKTKETKQEWVVLGYYYDLVNALKGVMKKYSRDVLNVATNIEEAVKTLQTIYDDIVTRFNGVEL
jgi:ferritin-like protein